MEKGCPLAQVRAGLQHLLRGLLQALQCSSAPGTFAQTPHIIPSKGLSVGKAAPGWQPLFRGSSFPGGPGSAGRPGESSGKSSAAPAAPPEGAEEAIGFFPALIALGCPAGTSCPALPAATSRLEAPASEDRDVPWWGCPSPSLSSNCSGALGPLLLSPHLRAGGTGTRGVRAGVAASNGHSGEIKSGAGRI